MAILRRLRGVLGTSIVWSAGWSVMLLPIVLWWWARLPCLEGCSAVVIFILLKSVAWWGATNGVLFALALSLTTRHRTVPALRVLHVIALGIAAGGWAP